jgi:hypothetical protein
MMGNGCDGTSITLAAMMNEQNTTIETFFVLPGVQQPLDKNLTRN